MRLVLVTGLVVGLMLAGGEALADDSRDHRRDSGSFLAGR